MQNVLLFFDWVFRLSRKAWLLTSTLVNLFPFSLRSSKNEGRRKGEYIAKIVIKSHAFLLDRVLIVSVTIPFFWPCNDYTVLWILNMPILFIRQYLSYYIIIIEILFLNIKSCIVMSITAKCFFTPFTSVLHKINS